MNTGFWTVAQVSSGQEFLFRNRLVEQQAGVGVYVPARRTMSATRRARKPQIMVYPAFARYVFIHFDQARLHERHLEQTWIDYRLMFADGKAVIVPSRELHRVYAMESEGFLDNLPKDASLQFTAGGIVRIIQGPFEGQNAPVLKTPGAWSKKITISLGGIPTLLPIDHCELA